MAKIAIIGPGAIGGVVAAGLAASGRHELILCARRMFDDLLVDTPSGPKRVRAKVVVDENIAEKVDLIIVTTKAYAVVETARWFKGLRNENTPVAVLQNGVEHRERFSPYLPGELIIPVMVDCPVERVSLTHIRQRGPAKLVAEMGAQGCALAEILDRSGISIELTSDLPSVLWRKLCTNCAGVISALVSQPAGVMHDGAIGDTARLLIRECIEVGRAHGAVLDDSIVETVLSNYRSAPPDSINSLHADRIAHRPVEIDARNGVIVRLGRKYNIATPCNQMAVALMGAIVRGYPAST